LIAVGCEEGVWIGIRYDIKSLRKVLHVKAVTNIAVLEEFGIFLVLQDKVSDVSFVREYPLTMTCRVCSHTTLRHWYLPLHLNKSELLLKGSVLGRISSSSPSASCLEERLSFT